MTIQNVIDIHTTIRTFLRLPHKAGPEALLLDDNESDAWKVVRALAGDGDLDDLAGAFGRLQLRANTPKWTIGVVFCIKDAIQGKIATKVN